MRIAVVVRSLKLGGMERAAVNLAEAFAREGHDAHLIYFKNVQELFPDPAVGVHRFDLEAQMRRSPAGLLGQLGARLLNAVMRRSYFYWSGFYLSKLFRRRLAALEKRTGPFDLIVARGQGTFETLWNLHDPRFVQVVESMFLFPGSALQNFYLRRLYAHKRIVCVSHGVRERFLQTADIAGFAPASVDIVTNPVDLETVRKQAQAYVPDIDGPYILSVGRITPNKNIPLLINAYMLLRARLRTPPKLVIVGDGHARESVERKIAELGAQAFVHLTGKLGNPYPWMKHADLFVLSSRFEGLGMVLIEAMACGTKVVATDAPGGVSDIMRGELARFVAAQTPQALAETMQRAMEAAVPDYSAALEAFSPAAVVAGWEALSKKPSGNSDASVCGE